MDKFIDYIKQYVQLSEEAEIAIRNVFSKKEYAKGELLSEEGKTCNHLYFLQEGAIRSFFYLNGKDITHWIYLENFVLTSWTSYIMRKPSTEYLETTEDSVIISINYDQMQELYKQYPELERFGRLILEEQIAMMDEFFKGYYFLSAKEKYELLTNAMPQITQKANLGHIASMLGISQETLSRIRGK
ncbi:cyclic nucleotide-binding domain-containing protein [Winogradskyella sp. 3972H.M.0a.05]|uniref:Crp/Fnr family transcriptional regulator n=1 Tax=Winogradskyella sp. 3972H.M.0a.05 TaxID=2950277 RepID=UPI003399CD66